MRNAMAAQNDELGVGSVVAAQYDIAVPALYHEIYILAVSRHVRRFIGLTPDFDVYPEQWSPATTTSAISDCFWVSAGMVG